MWLVPVFGSMLSHILNSFIAQWTIWQMLSRRDVLLGNPWKSLNLSRKHESCWIVLACASPSEVNLCSEYLGKEETFFLTRYCQKVQKSQVLDFEGVCCYHHIEIQQIQMLSNREIYQIMKPSFEATLSSSLHWDLWRLTSWQDLRTIPKSQGSVDVDLCFPNHQSFPEWIC